MIELLRSLWEALIDIYDNPMTDKHNPTLASHVQKGLDTLSIYYHKMVESDAYSRLTNVFVTCKMSNQTLCLRFTASTQRHSVKSL